MSEAPLIDEEHVRALFPQVDRPADCYAERAGPPDHGARSAHEPGGNDRQTRARAALRVADAF